MKSIGKLSLLVAGGLLADGAVQPSGELSDNVAIEKVFSKIPLSPQTPLDFSEYNKIFNRIQYEEKDDEIFLQCTGKNLRYVKTGPNDKKVKGKEAKGKEAKDNFTSIDGSSWSVYEDGFKFRNNSKVVNNGDLQISRGDNRIKARPMSKVSVQNEVCYAFGYDGAKPVGDQDIVVNFVGGRRKVAGRQKQLVRGNIESPSPEPRLPRA